MGAPCRVVMPSDPDDPGVALVAAAAIAFAAFCLVDLQRGPAVRHLPKWGWALVICVSVPWGGLAYLIFGRDGTGRGRHSRPGRCQRCQPQPGGARRAPRPRAGARPARSPDRAGPADQALRAGHRGGRPELHGPPGAR